MKRLGPHADDDLDDALWSADLLAAEEAALGAIPTAEPLPPRQVEALVAKATRGPRLLQRRLLLLAGLLALAIAPLAFLGAKIVWPERRQALLTLTYAGAVEVATNPDYDTSSHEGAVGLIAQACSYGAMTLRNVDKDGEDPAVRAKAAAIRTATVQAFESAPLETPAPVDRDFVATAATIADPKQPAEVRIAAMDDLGRMMRSGLMAFRASRENILLEPLSVEKMNAFSERLRRELQTPTRSGP